MVIAPPTSLGIKVNINTYDSWLWLLLITHPTIPYNSHLVGGLEHFLFFHILDIILPTDELIFFRGVGQPPTSNYPSNNTIQSMAISGT